DADIVIKAAAVADYRPKLSHEEKLKKTDDNQVFEMERTKDILKSLGDVKENQFLVGFAAETEDPLANGKIKLNKKKINTIKKNKENKILEIKRTKDIIKSLGDVKENQFLVGFAAETEDPLANGKIKLNKKNLDAIIINDVSKEGAGFGTDTNVVTYIDKN